MEGEISTPVTARKCAASGTVSRPAPQPKSSASSRPVHRPSRSRAAIPRGIAACPAVAACLLAVPHGRREDPAGDGHHRAVARSQPDPDDCGPALSCLRQIGPAAIVGLLLGMLALGPGLKRGFLLSYDMVSVPRQPFTATIFGLTGRSEE